MHDATLYPQKNVGGTGNVDLKVDNANFEKVMDCEVGASVQVDATAVKGYTGNQGQVYIQKKYEQFFIEGITLDEVEVIQVNGAPIKGNGDLYPENAEVVIQGTRTEV